MGLLDDYLNSSSETPAVETKPSAGGLLEQYLNSPSSETKPKSSAPVRPPISGVSKEASDEINAQPVKAGGANPRDVTASDVISAPKRAVGELLYGILEDASAGAKQATSDAFQDFQKGNVASAVGNVGMGSLNVLASPATGPIKKTGKLIENVTGNPDLANKAELIAGAAVPIVPGAKLVSRVSPTNKALDILVDKVTSNGREPQKLIDLVQRMKENPRITPADESPAVLNMAQKLFTTEGDVAKNYLYNTSSARIASSKDIVNQAFDTAAGLPVNAVNKIKELGDAAKKVGEEQINPAIKGAGAVNINPVINSIDEVLKPGVMSKLTGESTLPFPEVKEKLANIKAMIANEKEQLTDPQQLHNFQSLLRKEAEARMSSADGAQRQLGYSLMQVRNKIVDAIDDASPKGADGKGTYKPGLNNYRDKKEVGEAFHDAYNGILTNSKKLENRPEFTKDWFEGLTEYEKKAAIEGIRTRIDTEIGIAKNPALAGTSLGKSDFNQKKMETVLGKEETKKLLDELDTERKASNTHNKIIEGSQTEMRRAGDDAIALSKDNPKQKGSLAKYVVPAMATAAEIGSNASGIPMGVGTVASLAASGAGFVLGKAGSASKAKIIDLIEKERNAKLAKYAMPVEGAERDQLIRELEARIPGPKQSMVRRATNTGVRLGSLIAP